MGATIQQKGTTMTERDERAAVMYNLCMKDEACERGMNHDGECGLAIRNGSSVVRFIETEDERDA